MFRSVTLSALALLSGCGDSTGKASAVDGGGEGNSAGDACVDNSKAGACGTCIASDDCDQTDEPAYCHGPTKQCVAESGATCRLSSDCDDYDGLEDRICEAGQCVEVKCKEDVECGAVSATATCERSLCSDARWRCAQVPDDRQTPDGKASLRLQVQDLGSKPIRKTANLNVAVCLVSDFPCSPIAGAKATYDYVKGWLSVQGLMQKQRFRLEITSDGMLPVDWYTERVPVGDAEEGQPIFLIPIGLEQTIGNQFDPPLEVDLEANALLLIRSHDCMAGRGEGVSIEVTKPIVDTRIFYLDSRLSVLLDGQATDETGMAGIVNARAEPIIVTAKVGDTMVGRSAVAARAKVVTYLHLYPNDYSR